MCVALLKAIKVLVEFAHKRRIRVDKPLGLFHKNFFTKQSFHKCILNIQLLNGLVMSNSYNKNNPVSS